MYEEVMETETEKIRRKLKEIKDCYEGNVHPSCQTRPNAHLYIPLLIAMIESCLSDDSATVMVGAMEEYESERA